MEIRKKSCKNTKYFQYYGISYSLFLFSSTFLEYSFFVLALLTCMTKHKFKHYSNGYIQNCHTFCEKSGPNSSLPEPYMYMRLMHVYRLSSATLVHDFLIV